MYRRIMAWVMIIGFVVLLADILYIGYNRPMAASLYAVLVVAFLIYNVRNKEK